MIQRYVGALAALVVACAAPVLAAPPIEDYGRLPAVEQMRLSPDGDKLAYITVKDDVRQIVVAKVGGAPIVAVNGGAMKVRSLVWLGPNYVMVESSRTLAQDPSVASTQQIEAFQSTIINAATGKIYNVFASDLKIYHQTFGYAGYAEKNGKAVGYFLGISMTTSGSAMNDLSLAHSGGYLGHGHSDLFEVDLASGHAQRVFGGSELHSTGWLMNARGEASGHSEYDYKTGAWRLFADAQDHDLIARADNPTGDVGLIGFGRTDGTLLVRQQVEGNAYAYVEYPAQADARPAPLFPDLSIDYPIYDPTTGLLIGAVTTDDDPRTILFDPAKQARFDKARKLFATEQVVLVSASTDFGRMVLKTTGPGDSGTYFLVNFAAGQVSAIGWNYPTILQADVAEAKVVAFKAADGLEMSGILTLPPGREAKRLPVVVLPHGGPEDRDYLGFDFWAQAFASRGYAVFQPNFRGSDGFGKAFRDAGFGQWGRKMQTDLSDGLAELARQGIVDPKRACIVGGSYGGYAALAGVTLQQGLYRCAVSIGGIADLNRMLDWDHELMGDRSAGYRYERLFLGAAANGDGSVREISPIRFASRADAPVLLIWGKDDSVVDPNQSRLMAAALKGAGKPVETLELAGEDHWLSHQATRIQAIKASLDFVVRNSPPD